MRIAGYTDRPSVQPGETIDCHVSLVSDSAEDQAEFTAQIVRVVGVDEDAARERVETVDMETPDRLVARVEPTLTGSYGVAEVTLGGDGAADLEVEVTFMPTLLEGRRQALISVSDSDDGHSARMTLGIDGASCPFLTVRDDQGPGATFAVPHRLEVGRWYTIVGGFGPGTARVAVASIDDADCPSFEEEWSIARAPSIRQASVHLACRLAVAGDRAALEDNFTGRLEAPKLRSAGAILAHWDLGRGHDSFSIQDISGNANHGELHGLATRAVTGSNWNGKATSFVDDPEQYGAIHFFADAIEDAGWPRAVSVDVPADLRSGVHAFVLQCGDDRDTVPFVVSPTQTSPADILVVLPTATYMAYSNARFMWERVNWEVQRERSVEMGRGERMLLEHPEFGASSYDQYRDGFNITSVSWRRPNFDMRFNQCRGELYPSDMRLIDWLETRGYSYDVCSDDDLDRDGIDLLGRYRVAVTGTHPEYATRRCYAAVEAFLEQGGRLAVLGGDIYTWLVAFSDERPWVMEVRKPDNRPAGRRAASEAHLALTGEFSGDPDRRRPAERVLGTSTASMGFDAPRPYERLEASDDPQVEFIFAGVDGRVIGDDTRGGGVVFQEWDSTEEVTEFEIADDPPMVLARSSGHSPTTRWFGAGKRRNHAEMTFFTTDGGGAVFSVASMAWCLCLRRADVDRITANVLDRFLDPSDFDRAS